MSSVRKFNYFLKSSAGFLFLTDWINGIKQCFFTLFRQYFREKKAGSDHHHHHNNDGGSRFEPIPRIQQITKKEIQIQIQSNSHYNHHNRGTKHHSSPHHQNHGGPDRVSTGAKHCWPVHTAKQGNTQGIPIHHVMFTSFKSEPRFSSGG